MSALVRSGRRRLHPSSWAAMGVYLLLLVAAVLEQFGKTTSDTKASLIEDPGGLIRSTFTLWNPQISFGELQNQAYGYLFPQGPFFWLGDVVGLPPWVTERLWSVALIVVGCEGARRVAAAFGLHPWPSWVAGMTFGLNPRVLSEIGVRSAEVVPTLVAPWVLLPIVLVLSGRLDPRRGALFSAAAFLCFGGVNGTATVAPLPLFLVFLVWGIRRGLARWSFLAWWTALVVLVSVWWASSLVKLSHYSPPFFDYVEDARTTTLTTGFEASLRGVSNWVGYLTTGDQPSWPAAWDLNYALPLVVTSGLLAAVGVIGLVSFRSAWRTPLVISAIVGLVCLTIGHTYSGVFAWLDSPLAAPVQDLLDGPFALLRNVAKIDPVLRLPLAIGAGVGVQRILVATGRRQWPRRVGAGLVAALVLVTAQPAFAMNLRTPGWDEIPDYWTRTADFLAAQPGQNRAWVVPGSGFGVQPWGWTMDETMSVVGRSPWTTRSQVPLTHAETIRLLISLEDLLETGAGSPGLGDALARIGVGYVVVRHDLDPSLSEATASSLVAIALARSGGLERVRTFGSMDFGPAIEVYQVTGAEPADGFAVRDAARTATVSAGPGDVMSAVRLGLIAADRAAVVRGDSGWRRPADIVGDGYQLRMRQFGRVHAAEGTVLSPHERRHTDRVVGNYPGNPGARPVHARYLGIDHVDASSSQGFTTSFGAIQPESAPFAAVDGSVATAWTSSAFRPTLDQWLDVRFDRAHRFREVTLLSPRDIDGGGVSRWRVTVGKKSAVVDIDPFSGKGTVDLRGAIGNRMTVAVAGVSPEGWRGQAKLAEIEAAGLPAERTLVVPPVETSAHPDFLFSTRPPTPGCIPTLLGPDCRPDRRRSAEEAAALDRTFTVDRAGSWRLTGTVVARSTREALNLLDPWFGPVTVRASSTYFDEPTVAPRLAYDGQPTTSWFADPRDPEPTLTVTFATPRTIDRVSIAAPGKPAVPPQTMTIRSRGQERTVPVDGFGRFAPLRGRVFEVALANPDARGAPVGLAELRLSPGQTAVPLDGRTATGAPCGFGPTVLVDGERHLSKVTGAMGDVMGAGKLGLSLCGKRQLALQPGEHRLRIEPSAEFAPADVLLRATDDQQPPAAPSRSLEVLERTDTHQRARIGAGDAALLTTVRNFNDGWQATLDGEPLQVQRIDGWAQGWRIPAGKGGTVDISYTPQQSYFVGLVGGLAVAGLLLLLALILLARTRLHPGTFDAEALTERRRPGRHGALGVLRRVVLVCGGLALAWALGGVPAAMGIVVVLVLLPRRTLMLPLAGMLLAVAPLIAVLQLVAGQRIVLTPADLVAGVGVVLALGWWATRDHAV